MISYQCQCLHSQTRTIPSIPRAFRRKYSQNTVYCQAQTKSLQQSPSKSQLPADVHNTTAILTLGDATIYLLGISHVSKVSCNHINQLIDAVRPDTVFLELCKDRTGLLIKESTLPTMWYSPNVEIVGQDGKPTQQELLSMLLASKSQPVTVSDIEKDVAMLMSTGLFTSVRPVTLPLETEIPAPAFVHKNGLKFETAVPLGCIKYMTAAINSRPAAGTRDSITKSVSIPSNITENVKNTAVHITPWSRDIFDSTKADNSINTKQQSIIDSFGSFITQRYAKYQADAGGIVGVGTGTAWQVAMEAAARAGSRYVMLADRPARTTALRLSQGIWQSIFPYTLGALTASIAGAIGVLEATHHPEAAALAALVPLGVSAWPIAAPLLEVSQFSKKNAEEIENIVRVREPVQMEDGSPGAAVKFWGEDALLTWPGAMKPIIHERDAYMARAIAAAVLQKPEGLTPAYVKTQRAGDEAVYRYAMPENADARVAPPGQGEGTFEFAGGVKVAVAVVGTAHVHGMVQEWREISKGDADVSLKEFVV